MKIKKLVINSTENFWEDLINKADAIDHGIKVKYENEASFDNLMAAEIILAGDRLDIWRTIRDRKPKTITALAKMLNLELRKLKRDLEILVEFDLVKLSRRKGKSSEIIPTSLVDQIEFKIA